MALITTMGKAGVGLPLFLVLAPQYQNSFWYYSAEKRPKIHATTPREKTAGRVVLPAKRDGGALLLRGENRVQQ